MQKDVLLILLILYTEIKWLLSRYVRQVDPTKTSFTFQYLNFTMENDVIN
jgi:hypothetical protein